MDTENQNQVDPKEVAKLQARLEMLEEQNLKLQEEKTEFETNFKTTSQTLKEREDALEQTMAKAKEYEKASQLNSFKLKATQSGLKQEQTDVLADLIDLSKVGDEIDLSLFVMKDEPAQEGPAKGFKQEDSEKPKELTMEEQLAELLGK